MTQGHNNRSRYTQSQQAKRSRRSKTSTEDDHVFDALELEARACSYSTKIESTGHMRKFSAWGESFPISVHALVDLARQHTDVWVHIRTTSLRCMWSGDRTDLHDALAHIVAFVLRVTGHSCSLWEIAHPVTGIPTEVYGYHIRFDQGPLAALSSNTASVEHIGEALLCAKMAWNIFWESFWLTDDTLPDDAIDTQRSASWARRLANATNEPFDSDDIQHVWRHHPTWMHYRSIATGFIVFNCCKLLRGLGAAIETSRRRLERLETSSHVLFKGDGVVNGTALADVRIATNLITTLERSPTADQCVIPLEDRIVVCGRRHLVVKMVPSGKRVFEDARSAIIARHQKEMEFVGARFEWADVLDPVLFERLALDLLEREPGVIRVRQVGPTNQPDGGRDHVAEWNTPPHPSQQIPEDQPPQVFRQVMVQCKGQTTTTGTRDVFGIRDAMEQYDCTGFLLVTATQVSVPLFDRLNKMRADPNQFVDWWERPQIEQRLLEHPLIAARYTKVVKLC